MIQSETESDLDLQRIIHFLKTGWPQNITDNYIMQFYRRKDALTVVDGCLMLSERIVIPKTLQTRVLRQLHSGHPGITRMKAPGRSYAYWPNIDKQIEEYVR